jgi:hypothetical protein
MNDLQRNKEETEPKEASDKETGPEKAPSFERPVKDKGERLGGFGIKMPKVGPGNFWNNILSTLLLLLLLTSI